MLGEIDATDFAIAERLGKSLADVGELSNREFVAWRSWFKYQTAMSELNHKTAMSRGKRR